MFKIIEPVRRTGPLVRGESADCPSPVHRLSVCPRTVRELSVGPCPTDANRETHRSADCPRTGPLDLNRALLATPPNYYPHTLSNRSRTCRIVLECISGILLESSSNRNNCDIGLSGTGSRRLRLRQEKAICLLVDQPMTDIGIHCRKCIFYTSVC